MLPSEFIIQNHLAILSHPELDMIDRIVSDSRIKNDCPKCAYILGTIKHETANTFLPIKEYGEGRDKVYGKADPITKQVYYGRGYVQLTWKGNYDRFGQLLKIDLGSNPDLALDPQVAYNIMITGMMNGLFTGKKLSDYINEYEKDYINARRVINGTNQADLIAQHAQSFEDLLNKIPKGI